VALSGHSAMSDSSLLCGLKRTSAKQPGQTAYEKNPRRPLDGVQFGRATVEGIPCHVNWARDGSGIDMRGVRAEFIVITHLWSVHVASMSHGVARGVCKSLKQHGNSCNILRHDRGRQRQHNSLKSLVPVERIELPTFGLQNRCSTAELNRHSK
jgi:hypothetical protein